MIQGSAEAHPQGGHPYGTDPRQASAGKCIQSPKYESRFDSRANETNDEDEQSVLFSVPGQRKVECQQTKNHDGTDYGSAVVRSKETGGPADIELRNAQDIADHDGIGIASLGVFAF